MVEQPFPPVREDSSTAPGVNGPQAEPVLARVANHDTGDSRHACPPTPVLGRELLAVLLLVVLADVTVYRGPGYSGYALGLGIAPLLLMLGMPRPRGTAWAWMVGGMLLLLSAKLVWCGDDLLVAVGGVWLLALALALAGRTPCVLDVVLLALQVPVGGCVGLARYRQAAHKPKKGVSRGGWLGVLLPLGALLVFGTIFVLANPDLLRALQEWLRRGFNAVCDWWVDYGPSWMEVFFWMIVFWGAVGLLRPVIRGSLLGWFRELAKDGAIGERASESPLFIALRNMLVTVIVLFAAYLVFEFKTLWFRTFPQGFYYAGYAHEGAAWLTFALALATGLLSWVFRGNTLRDRRLPRLRRLAWIWSAENLILALAVYNRLFIYIQFNGMTRMRTVGLIGMTAVVVGFVLVVWKIAAQRDFVWLLRRHLWTLAVAIYVLSVLPVDTLVHHYNVRRVLAGDLAPAVQISVHPISAEGMLVLAPLLQCEDPVIREGIAAMLAEESLGSEAAAQERGAADWRQWQGADRGLRRQLQRLAPQLLAYRDPSQRAAALARFRQYAYQWY